MLTSLADMMGRSRYSIRQAMERTRKTIVRHRGRFVLDHTAWVCLVFILNASAASAAHLRPCKEVRDRSRWCFCVHSQRSLRLVQFIKLVLHTLACFSSICGFHTFTCTFGISLFTDTCSKIM